MKEYPLKTEYGEDQRLAPVRQPQLAPERAARSEHRQRHRQP